uniref:Putative NADH dehydrogenase n=1 Tax=viral metagenome TaxID=1070528 RepID=A0A6M3M7N3_9ZZZZ
MKILVTGGTGFLGKAVSKRLIDLSYDVTIIDNRFTSRNTVENAEFVSGSVTNINLVEKLIRDTDFVFHFAGILGTNETLDIIQQTNEVNINGTVNVLQACTKYKVPMIFTSKPNPPGFLNPYTITKETCEKYCMMFHEMYQTKVAIPKIMYLFGLEQLPYPLANYKKYIPTFVLAALRNEPIEIYGSGDQIIDPIYIDEAAEVMIKIMNDLITDEKTNGKIFDVGTGIGVSVNEIVKIIKKLTGSKSEVVHVQMRDGEPETSMVVANLNSSPIDQNKHLNFYKALKKTIGFYEKSYDVIK